MYLYRAADLPLLTIKVAENHVRFEGVGVESRGLPELLDGQVDLVGDQEVQSQDVVRRLSRLASVDPASAAQLVALPRLADGEPDEQRDERDDERCGGRLTHGPILSGLRVPRAPGATDRGP